jgi:hypothetical protein
MAADRTADEIQSSARIEDQSTASHTGSTFVRGSPWGVLRLYAGRHT